MSIIISTEKIKLYERLSQICEQIGYTDEWKDDFWLKLLENPDVYEEFLYYAQNGSFLCRNKVGDQSVVDITVWEMRKYNVRRDRGKNGPDCDKTAMVMEAFSSMMKLKEDPDAMMRRLESNGGMDRL